MKRFIVLDFETTGLSPKDDEILEAAWSITDDKFRNATRTQGYVVTPSQNAWALLKANPYVEQMHAKTKLLEDMMKKGTLVLGDIEDYLLGDMKRREMVGDSWHLLGASVHFDRSFIDIHMPRLAEKLHHRILDTSSLKLMAEASGLVIREPLNVLPHRAKNDVDEALAYARAFQIEIGHGMTALRQMVGAR